MRPDRLKRGAGYCHHKEIKKAPRVKRIEHEEETMFKIIKPGKPRDYFKTTCRDCHTTYLFQIDDLSFECGLPHILRYGELCCPSCDRSTWADDEDISMCDEDGNSEVLTSNHRLVRDSNEE